MSAENTLRPGALKEGLFDSGLVPAPCASVNDMRSYQPLNFFPSKTESVCWFGRLDTTAQMLQFERNAYAVFWLKPDGALYSRQNIRPEFNKSLRSELVLPRREKDATGKWKVIVKKGREVLDSREFYLLELA